MKYPFTPKSTASMIEGQIISIPLSNGTYACGRVLEIRKGSRTAFLVALMDWNSPNSPDSNTITNSKILKHGQVHIKAIIESGSEIVGHRELALDEIEIPLTLDSSPDTKCLLRQGFTTLGYASTEQRKTLKVFSTWGYSVLKNTAEHNYG
jgi:hypothetical protein